MLQQLLPVLAPVFIAIAIGWLWVKSGRDYDTRMVTELVTLVGTPCLVFSTLSGLEVEPALVASVGLATALALGLAGLSGALALALSGQPVRAFLPPMMFGNIGNMGLPLCLFAFGEQGLGLGVVVFAITTVSMFTIGVAIYSGQGAVRVLLKNPLIYAVAAALPFLFGGWAVPRWLANATGMIGDFTIPLMIITLGVSLARLRVGQVPRALWLAILRLSLGFAAGLAASALLGLEGVARGVLILQSSMPVAVFNFLFAQRYAHYPEETAGVVVLSTVLALGMLPFLLAWLM